MFGNIPEPTGAGLARKSVQAHFKLNCWIKSYLVSKKKSIFACFLTMFSVKSESSSWFPVAQNSMS